MSIITAIMLTGDETGGRRMVDENAEGRRKMVRNSVRVRLCEAHKT
jgi:hypothetical protein